MRKIIALTAAVGMLGATAAMSQTTSPTQTQPQSPQQKTQPPVGVPPTPQAQTPAPGTTATMPSGQQGAFLNQQQAGQMLASDMMNKSILGANNERIGEVDDLLVSKDGDVVAVLVGVGGFLGIGEKTVAIPFDSLQRSAEADQLTVRYSRQDLENAPRFVTAKTRERGTGTTGGGGTTGTAPSGTQR